MCKEITFDEANHKYYRNGIPLPSVTQVMPKQSGLSFVSSERLEECRQDGNMNHLEVNRYFLTKEVGDNKYVQGVDKFIKDFPEIGQFVGSEVLVYSKFNYAGQADILFENAVVDIKRTIGNQKIHALQLAGYSLAAIEMNLIKPNVNHIILTINDKGDYLATNVWNDLSKTLFLLCVKKYWSKDDQYIEAVDQTIKNYLEA